MAMTARDEMCARLESCGMSAVQASTIMEQAKNAEELGAMRERWNDPIDDYPAVLLDVTWRSVCEVARDWVAEHVPNAWYRSILDE